MQYNYDQEKNEFVENPSGIEDDNLTGNRVFVCMDGELPRYRVEIDDFGCVIAALNRLMKRLVPTFLFPKTDNPKHDCDPMIADVGAFGDLIRPMFGGVGPIQKNNNSKSEMVDMAGIVSEWFDHFPDHELRVLTRDELTSWIVNPTLNGNTLSIQEVYKITNVDLVVDFLIMSGFGQGNIAYHTVSILKSL